MLTFEKLPEAVFELQQSIYELKKLMLDRSSKETTTEQEEVLTVDDAAKFLKLSKATIYSLTSKGLIPYMKKSKRVYFSKLEIIEYLKKGRNKTMEEIDQETDTYLQTLKKVKP